MTQTTTLLNLVQTVNMFAATDEETVATIVYLVNSGKVRLCGTFAGAQIDIAVSPSQQKDLNQATEDSYTSSLAVESFPFGLSVAERSRRPTNPAMTPSSTPPLTRLRSERAEGKALKQCGTVPVSCGSI